MALVRLHALVVQSSQDRSRAEDKAGERPASVIGVPLDPGRLDELQPGTQLRGRQPPALPVGMQIHPREPHRLEGADRLDERGVLVIEQLLAQPAERLLAGSLRTLWMRVQEVGAQLWERSST